MATKPTRADLESSETVNIEGDGRPRDELESSDFVVNFIYAVLQHDRRQQDTETMINWLLNETQSLQPQSRKDVLTLARPAVVAITEKLASNRERLITQVPKVLQYLDERHEKRPEAPNQETSSTERAVMDLAGVVERVTEKFMELSKSKPSISPGFLPGRVAVEPSWGGNSPVNADPISSAKYLDEIFDNPLETNMGDLSSQTQTLDHSSSGSPNLKSLTDDPKKN